MTTTAAGGEPGVLVRLIGGPLDGQTGRLPPGPLPKSFVVAVPPRFAVYWGTPPESAYAWREVTYRLRDGGAGERRDEGRPPVYVCARSRLAS